jgi:hypothetical protein
LRKSERPQLMSDIKEAGGTEGIYFWLYSVSLLGLIRAGSTNQKAAMFEKEINDQKKSTEVGQKKTVWGMSSLAAVSHLIL